MYGDLSILVDEKHRIGFLKLDPVILLPSTQIIKARITCLFLEVVAKAMKNLTIYGDSILRIGNGKRYMLMERFLCRGVVTQLIPSITS